MSRSTRKKRPDGDNPSTGKTDAVKTTRVTVFKPGIPAKFARSVPTRPDGEKSSRGSRPTL